jgi:hypothetical protein
MASSRMLRRLDLVRTDVSEELSVRRLLVTGSVVPSSPILGTLMKEVLSFSETSLLRRATRRNIPEDGILQNIVLCLLKLFKSVLIVLRSRKLRLTTVGDAPR